MSTKNNNSSSQQFLGLAAFGKLGLILDDKTEVVFWAVSPSNIAVLSEDSVERKVDKLASLLSAFPELEIVCIDGCECFDNNKVFLNQRIAEEENEAVRALLAKDREFMDSIQSEMANSRQFYFVYSFVNQTSDMMNTTATRIEKAMTEYDFICHRLDKSEQKQMLAVYFGISTYGDSIPDYELEGAINAV